MMRRVPRRVWRILDAAGRVLLVGGAIVALTGGTRFTILGLTISLRGELRLYFWALLCFVLAFVWDRERSTISGFLAATRETGVPNEAALFAPLPAPTRSRRLFELGLVVAGFCALVAALTWPQIARLTWVSDLGDPLFSTWRIAWVSHALATDPLHIFDANIFYPERLTLTYSDPVIVPALLTAPFFWLGGHPIVLYNLLFLSGFVFSGVAMFLLVRALTGDRGAALLAGAMFALYPYRFEHYSHLELQMTMWMPLALYALHRTLAGGQIRDGMATGGAVALQTLSCLYYGVFFTTYLLPLTAVLWHVHRPGWRTVRSLALGVALAIVLVLPVAIAFHESKEMVGERDLGAVRFYSAEPGDYFRANHRNVIYGQLLGPGGPERELFPGIAPLVLAAIGLWRARSVRIAYAVALLFVLDASLGMNGTTYPWLREYLEPFRSLRVPARFSILAGMTLTILAGYGAARLLRRWPQHRPVLVVGLFAVVIVEALPRIPLERAWEQIPPIYDSLQERGPVLAEFPMPSEESQFFIDGRYMYFSSSHWQKLVNGNSGFFPPSYHELIAEMAAFPQGSAIRYLKTRGVTHIAVHGAFYPDQADFLRVVTQLDLRTDLEAVASVPWEDSQSRLYRFVAER